MRPLIGAGLWLGLVAGALDGVTIVRENPATFGSALESVRFVAAAMALYGGFGGLVGIGAGAWRARTGHPRPSTLAALAVAFGLFAWAGVRVHVRWFFGEPILSLPSLLANVALLGGASLVAWGLRPLRRRFAEGMARRGALRAAGAVLLVVATVTAAPRMARPRPPRVERAASDARDVLLVTLDTTRADHLSCYGYPRGTSPALDRLARRGTIDVLWSAIPLTNPSHCSLLTGLPPRSHGVRNNGTALPDSVPTIVEALAADGFHCGAFVSGIPLKSALSGLGKGFATYDDAFSVFERVHPMLTSLALVRVADRVLPGDLLERRAEHTVDAAIAWLAETPSPRFLWVHLFDPHTPYRAAPPLVHRFARESADWTAEGRPVTTWPVADYDAELRGTDHAVGRLLRAFADVAPDGVACVTADHGEGLLQHGELTLGALLHEEDLDLPWIVGDAAAAATGAAARGTGARPPRAATDVAGLLLALAHREPPPPPGAGPAVSETFPPEGRGRRTAMVGVLPDGRIGKTLTDWDREETVAFDLTADPGETRPGPASGTEWAGLRPAGPDRGPEASLDPEVERRLRALGYVH